MEQDKKGLPKIPMKCPRCGHSESDVFFCRKCGRPVEFAGEENK